MGRWLVLCSVLVGCGLASTAPVSVLRQFDAQFNCRVMDSAYTPGGYQVAGCGTEAFYHCSPASVYDCWMTNHRPMTPEAQQAQRDRLLRVIASTDGERPASSARFAGGYIALYEPPNEPGFLVLSVQGDQPLATDCELSVQYEGKPLTVISTRQRDASRLQMLTFAEELSGLRWSERFGGSLCGKPFGLDKYARRQLSQYDH